MIKKISRKKKIISLCIALLILVVFLIVILLVITRHTSRMFELNKVNRSENSINSNFVINLVDNDIVHNKDLKIDININNFEEESVYKVEIRINNIIKVEEEINSQNTFNVDLENEGSKDINILIYKNAEENYNNMFKIYYIKPYKKQFLDEYEKYGVSTHFAYGIDGRESLELVKILGAKVIRDDVLWKWIIKEDGSYDFTRYDFWVNECIENNITIITIMFGPGEYAGEDEKISSNEELNGYINFVETFAQHYPQITEYEIWNEPNDLYVTDEEIYWYSKAVIETSKTLKQINPEIKIISGSTDTSNNAKVESLNFFQSLISNDVYTYSDAFSYHPYDVGIGNMSNSLFYNKLDSHENLIVENGGFIHSYITEYGASTH